MKPRNSLTPDSLLTDIGITEPPVEVRAPSRSRYTFQKYTCKKDHESSILVEDRDRLKTQKCKTCGKKAEHVYVTQAVNALPQATIVYEKPVDGKMKRMYVDPQEPASIAEAEKDGYQRREIQGMRAMRQFEKEVTQEMKEDFARRTRGEAEQREELSRQRNSELRDMMNQPGVDEFSKGLIQAAIDDQGGYSQAFDPEFRSGAYS